MATERDPDARRLAIITAAADLIRRGNAGRLTHRKVAEHAGIALGSTTYYFRSLEDLTRAALELLAEEIDMALTKIRAALAERGAAPESIADLFCDYLADRDTVQAETALYVAGIERPELRGLSRRWFDGLVDALAEGVGHQSAFALAVFADGATLHAALHDTPIDRDTVLAIATSLITSENR